MDCLVGWARTKCILGHGRSHAWRDMKDLLQDRLQLPWDEFNRGPQAGRSTKERLEEMPHHACFALLVMTAEDEHADQRIHATANLTTPCTRPHIDASPAGNPSADSRPGHPTGRAQAGACRRPAWRPNLGSAGASEESNKN